MAKILASNNGRLSLSVFLTVLMATAMVTGCSGGAGNKPTARVTGKVTHEGKPVPGGVLVFSPVRDSKTPMPGKAGQAEVKSDGTFSVSTYSENDGAVIGKHDISFSPPAVAAPQSSPDGAHVESAAPPSPFAGLVPKPAQVSIEKGENKIEIELVK